jgi:GNAT superfamily N-acetyltransferase
MSTSLTIRPLTLADHAAWLPLWAGYNTFYQADVPAAVTAETWRRFHDPVMPMFVLGAFADGADGKVEQLIGFATYQFHLSSWSIGPVCYLEDLFTSASARGRGAGAAMIAAVADAARAAQASRLYWVTHETNKTAQALYDRVAKNSGFIQYTRDLG